MTSKNKVGVFFCHAGTGRLDGLGMGHRPLLYPSDLATRSVAIIHCLPIFNQHCSRVCCMYSLKFIHLVKSVCGARPLGPGPCAKAQHNKWFVNRN